jgi:hypothetical protein
VVIKSSVEEISLDNLVVLLTNGGRIVSHVPASLPLVMVRFFKTSHRRYFFESGFVVFYLSFVAMYSLQQRQEARGCTLQ